MSTHEKSIILHKIFNPKIFSLFCLIIRMNIPDNIDSDTKHMTSTKQPSIIDTLLYSPHSPLREKNYHSVSKF